MHYGVVEGFTSAVEQTWQMSALTVKMLGKMLIGQASLKNLSGPVTIADYAGQSMRLGLAYYLADVGRAWDTLEIEPTRFIEAGRDAVVVEGHVRAWGSGRVVDAPASWLWTLSNGKVESVRIFDSADGAAAAARSEGRPVREPGDQDR